MNNVFEFNEVQMFQDMKALAFESGQMALQMMHDSRPGLKPDNSVITQTDHAISQLAHQRLTDYLVTDHHLIIDEEDPNGHQYKDETLKQTAYIWSIDPIDGTRLYANKMHHFGISIGVLKQSRPYMGIVYFPALEELFYADGSSAGHLQSAFTTEEEHQPMMVQDESLTNQSIFYCHESFFQTYDWIQHDCRVMIMASAVVDMCWPAIGRGCGSILQPSLWDFAGSWPIARAAGLELREFNTGDVLDHLDLPRFGRGDNPWELKDQYILSSAKNFVLLRERIKARI